MVLFSSRRRRQRETRANVRERRVKSASISHNRQREEEEEKGRPAAIPKTTDEEYEGTKGRRTSDDVHDVSDDREGDDALARESTLEYLNFWGKRQSISVTKTRHERSRVVVVIACLTARSTTRLRLRTT